MNKNTKYPVIVIFKEKHGDRYFIANNQEELGKICLQVLTERFDDGYWYYKPEPLGEDDKIIDIPEDLPEDVKGDIERRNGAMRNKIRSHKYAVHDYKLIEKAYQDRDPKAAYHVLQNRSAYEYEEMAIEYPMDIK
jgi:hypothetical protein